MSGLFSGEGDNPPPFMQKPEQSANDPKDNPADNTGEVEPAPEQKPAEAVVEKSTEEAEAAVERSAEATAPVSAAPPSVIAENAPPPTLTAEDIVKGADFATIMKAGQIKAKDDKVLAIIERAKEGYTTLVEKIGEDQARQVVGNLYMEAIEGKLIAATAAQKNTDSQ